MKWSRKWALAATLLGAGAAARADLARWIQDLPSPGELQAIFFRAMALPGGPIEVRRPPKETRAELAKRIAASPSRSDLYALRAHEDELQLDFAAAQGDWKKHAELSGGKVEASLSLADYYHRRIQPKEEIAALEAVGKAPAVGNERYLPAAEQQSWKAYQRIQSVIEEQALPAEMAVAEYRAWVARYASEPELHKQFFRAMAAKKQFEEARRALADYRRAFPADAVFPVLADATLAAAQGSDADALAIYDRGFQPLWPNELVSSYFERLKQNHQLRKFLEQARLEIAAKPGDIVPAARVYYYHQQSNNAAAALRALYEYRRRKESAKLTWTAEEAWTLGKLFEDARSYDDAARSDVTLYNLGGADNQRRALAALANVLLTAPDQPIRFGAGGLSYYRDIAQMDPGPGYLNGVLSLLFNNSGMQFQYENENQVSGSYFHRAKASELISQLQRRFPDAPERAALEEKLIAAYATYGDNNGVIGAGRRFLASFPDAPERTAVAMSMADAYSRQQKTREEFAIYDDLLKALAARAENVPLGEHAVALAPGDPQGVQARRFPRSAEYARVLDRYIGRLAALRRPNEALALYRREIDRNPNDPGLYERLAGFLDQSKLGAELEAVYRKAMAQFPDRTWSQKLARWCLREKRVTQFDALTREVAGIFSGTELESYLAAANQGGPLAPALYRQVNLYAHQRFPNDLAFVRNLTAAYAAKGTADPAAREKLLRSYWFYEPDLRDQFFELLSRAGRLRTELAAIQKPDAAANPAAARFLAEGEAWQSHYEAAAPLFRAVAQQYPGDVEGQARAASMYRSLATYDAPGNFRNTEIAASLQENVAKFAPRDTAALATVGDIYGDRELFGRARPFWDRIAAVAPGRADGYIEAATIYWDYYRFDEALRFIAEARQRLKQPGLYTYEAGAIHENQRDYGRAIGEYAKGALAEPTPDQQSRWRIVQLSRRPDQRAAIEDLTVKAAAGPDASLSAVSLRVEVLTGQDRLDDLRQFLAAKASSASSAEVLQALDEAAVAHGFENVQEQTRLRRIALAVDPVERLQAQIDMSHFYESHKNLPAAGRIIEDLHKTNPAVLGVVRASVDYYWRVKDSRRAVDLLEEAAKIAQPSYRDSFALEAARKATEAGDQNRARGFLAALLKDAPYRSEYVSAMADTYARQNDDRGLRDFYNDRLKAVQQARMPPAEKVEIAAAIRRGLIPVLTRLQDFAGAVDQYIEVLNRYPEDADLAREAATYAAAHGRGEQLAGYYQKARQQSPRDYRWPLVEARVQTQLENFPAAVASYQQAAELRPDRLDFYSDRAGIEERLLRFEEAAATYAKLYELSYHNSQWMVKAAEIRARQRRNDEAAKALNAAWVEGRPPSAQAYFAVAEKLESWDLLPQAREYAEKGAAVAGPDPLTSRPGDVQTYLRVMTKQRRYEAAYQMLTAWAGGKEIEPYVAQAMGWAVSLTYTPEEKAAFAAFAAPRADILLPAIQKAGLWDVAVTALAKKPDQLVPLQQKRLQFTELAAQLEAYWRSLPPDAPNRDSYLQMAAQNYRLGGDAVGELRVLSLERGSLPEPMLERFAALLSRAPQRFDALAAATNEPLGLRNALGNYALKAGPAQRALQVVAARGQGEAPIWTRAYTALTGLYYGLNTPRVQGAFTQALGTATIGEQLGKAVDRNQQLTGDLWFSYGSRYGEYLYFNKASGAEDYLPAGVEARPGSADAYYQLAEFYHEANQPAAAIPEYRNALQLDAGRIGAHERLASILAQQGKPGEAIAEFREAIEAASRQLRERHTAATFVEDLRNTIEDIGKAKLLEPLRPELDRLLRGYVRGFGNFRVDGVMQAILAASGNPASGVAWILEISRAAPDPAVFLSGEVNAEWVPESQRPAIYRALIASAEAKPEMEQELRNRQVEFASYLVDHQAVQEAASVLAAIPKEARETHSMQIVSIEARLAARSGALPAFLRRWSAEPYSRQRLEEVSRAASDLDVAGDRISSRQLLEWVYSRLLEAHEFGPSTFLGLAEIRLDRGDTAGALALLRRMTMIAGEPFETLLEAASLLTRKGRLQEAVPFLEQRVQAVPWDLSARLQLAKAQGDADALRAIAQTSGALYEARAEAARALGERKAAPLSGFPAELALLSNLQAAPAAAEQPYFVFARVAAAARTNDSEAKIRLLRGAIAIDPAREDLKLDLIRAALAAKRWQLAVSAAPRQAPISYAYAGIGAASGAISRRAFRFRVSRAEGEQSSFAAWKGEDLMNVERGLAQAYEALGEIDQALSLYQTAAISGDVQRLRAQLEREARNAARRPVIKQELEQDRVVRPRLLAATGGSR